MGERELHLSALNFGRVTYIQHQGKLLHIHICGGVFLANLCISIWCGTMNAPT